MLTPYYTDSLATLYQGDVLDVLRQLPSGSVQCVVTSPPYYSLRDYGTGTWDGGDPDCDHLHPKGANPERQLATSTLGHDSKTQGHQQQRYGATCGRCGATRIDQQIGLEATPEAFIAKLVAVFREVRRVLRDDGTLWCNIGDSYNGSGGAGGDYGEGGLKEGQPRYPGRRLGGDLKPKDLIGIPWMLAFALRADGWYLRSDIIWHKPNPMPESVTDRPAKAHEYVFLLTKSARYYYDADAVREPHAGPLHAPGNKFRPEMVAGPMDRGGRSQWERDMSETWGNPAGRNKRTVWTIATAPYPNAHFATYPPALVEPCILAGTSERGACPHCGAPWRRVVSRELVPSGKSAKRGTARDVNDHRDKWGDEHGSYAVTTTGWEQSCACPAAEPVPCVVLEPFAGSGTTLMVAKRLVRRSIGIDLNPEYLDLAVKRIRSAEPGVQMDMAMEGA